MSGETAASNESVHTSPSGKVARRALNVAVITLISRILGLIRDMLMAWRFGAGTAADAFNFAFLIPNLLRRLLAEGAVSVALVPVFGEVRRKEGDASVFTLYRKAIGVYSIALLLFLSFITLLLPYALPFLVYGFSPEKQKLTSDLTQLMMPFTFCFALGSVSIALLHTLKKFNVPAFASVVENIVIIGGIVYLTTLFVTPIYGVAISVSISGLFIYLMLVMRLKKEGVAIMPVFKWDSRLGEMVKLMGTAFLGVMVYYLNILFSKFLASFLDEGSITRLYYSERLFELPLGIIAVSVATVTLPELTGLADKEDLSKFRNMLYRSIRLSLFLCIPAAVGMFVLREPLIMLLFRHGRFNVEDAEITSVIFRNAIPGLIFVAGLRVAVQSFYSLKQPIKAVKISLISFLTNALCSIVLIKPLGVAGLTLANSISSFVNISLSIIISEKMLVSMGAPEMEKGEKLNIVKSLSLMTLASLIMGVFLYVILHYSSPWVTTTITRLVLVSVITLLGCVLYFVVVHLLKVEEAHTFLSKLSRRFK